MLWPVDNNTEQFRHWRIDQRPGFVLTPYQFRTNRLSLVERWMRITLRGRILWRNNPLTKIWMWRIKDKLMITGKFESMAVHVYDGRQTLIVGSTPSANSEFDAYVRHIYLSQPCIYCVHLLYPELATRIYFYIWLPYAYLYTGWLHVHRDLHVYYHLAQWNWNLVKFFMSPRSAGITSRIGSSRGA